MTISAEEIRAAFGAAVCRHECPSCGKSLTPAAVAWGDAWREGYDDRVREEGLLVRDGPFKIACESCGARAWYEVFSDSLREA
jgi:hypothetical protein